MYSCQHSLFLSTWSGRLKAGFFLGDFEGQVSIQDTKMNFFLFFLGVDVDEQVDVDE
jgi:hypothetical protein